MARFTTLPMNWIILARYGSLLLLFFAFALFKMSAQPTQAQWSLEDCISYAMENNIQIKQSVLNTQYNENLLKQAKLSQIPSLNGSTGYTYSWGRALDQTTYRQIYDARLDVSTELSKIMGSPVAADFRTGTGTSVEWKDVGVDRFSSPEGAATPR